MLHPRGPQALTIHTVDGRPITALPDTTILSSSWTRERSEVSTCEVTANTLDATGVTPWYHWVTAWDGDHPVWTGPIQRAQEGIRTTQITARDVSTFMWRTRMDTTRTWTGIDTAAAAREVWAAMLELHRVDVEPIVHRSLAGTLFDLETDSASMVNDFMDDLTGLGLAWTVVAGRPILGTPHDDTPRADLHESDIAAEIEVIRDGTNTYNDVYVRGQDAGAYATTPMGDLRLQATVSMDNLRGAPNIQHAAREYLAQVAGVRETLLIPDGASLRLDQPFGLDTLVPGALFTVWARGRSAVMRLTQVKVDRTPTTYDVAVTLTGLDEQEG